MALPTNVPQRIGRRLRKVSTRVQHRLAFPTLRPGPVRIAAQFQHPIAATRKSELIARYESLFSGSAAKELDEAEMLLQHRFSLLGHNVTFGPQIAWSRDPVSGQDWSRDFSPDIPYRGPQRLGDIKLPWELSKHQYFFTLGKAAWLSGERRFAEEIIRQIEDWIESNPCHQGIHWISALETGTRAVSWIVTYPFFAEFCSNSLRTRILDSIARHMLFVEQNLSTGQYTNTHLVGEAAALAIGGMFLDCRHSARWRRKGRLVLDAEARRQVRPDGVHAEQSVAYHRFFLDQYYLVDAMLNANGSRLAPPTAQVIENMTAFLMDVLFPDGSAPAFGDCDDARGIWCRADCPNDYRALLALGAARFGRGDFKQISAGPPEELLWLYGEQGLDRYSAIPSVQPAHTSAAYRHSGYYIMRSGWNDDDAVLVFDCGPLGHGPASHGHADALSFQLHAKGHCFFVDSGTYSYNLDYDWRQAFRSTRAHSTINVDDLDQSVARDRMSWSSIAHAHANDWISTPFFDLVDGAHDGYRRLTDPVAHRRIVIFLKPDIWLIYDSLDSRERHELEILFHVDPDCTIASGTANADFEVETPQGQRLCFSDLSQSNLLGALDVLAPARSEMVPFFSSRYGHRRPGHAVHGRCTWSGTIELLSGIFARDDLEFDVTLRGRVLLRWLDAHGSAGCFYYRTFANASLEEEDVTFDGKLLFRSSTKVSSQVLYACDCSRLSLPGKLELRAPTAVQSIEIRDKRVLITARENAGDMTVAVHPDLRVTINGQPRPTDTMPESV